ncbi:MAG TPA: MraY family glycosyltransferase [Usitatibacter sp.]|nr:MraY family glycosyltransferase [Usitatibacter sp.]
MAPQAGRIVVHLGLAFALSCVAMVLLRSCARRLNLVDVPCSRKAHGGEVPLVGGLAIFLAVLAAQWLLAAPTQIAGLHLALSVVIAVGLWDDIAEISPGVKLAAEMAASGVMIFGAGILLHGVGDILGWRPLGLSILAVPVTVFAMVGVVNSMNMIDGMDGLAGCIALVAFAWYAAVASLCGLDMQLDAALLLCGAIAGFLLFNIRYPGHAHARAFLGDAGSLLLGFALGWFAIDLTQGPGRSFPPIAALWVVLLPLADCVSVMARRVSAGRNPFVADRQHIHHYLAARGFTHGQTLALLVGVSTLFGAVGFAGWRLAMPEAALFWPFFFGFFAYHAWIQRAWKKVAAEPGPLPEVLVLDEEEARVPG